VDRTLTKRELSFCKSEASYHFQLANERARGHRPPRLVEMTCSPSHVSLPVLEFLAVFLQNILKFLIY
jgi:hypothetical protein